MTIMEEKMNINRVVSEPRGMNLEEIGRKGIVTVVAVEMREMSEREGKGTGDQNIVNVSINPIDPNIESED
jgi:hypothetical protein